MTPSAPRVSIGMPVYNGERYIAQALESLLAQDFTDFEIIIADNASTDETYAICQAFAQEDARVRLYRNQTNIGGDQNFNLVANQATGEYFKWAADDDWCAPPFLSRCVEVLDEDPSVVLAYPRTVLVNDDGSTRGNYEELVDASSPRASMRFLNMFWDLNLVNMLFGVMRTDALRKTKLLMPHLSWADVFFLAELAMEGRIIPIDEPLFFRRMSTRREGRGTFKVKFGGRPVEYAQKRTALFAEYVKLISRAEKLSLRERAWLFGNIGLGFVAGHWPRRVLRERMEKKTKA